MALVSQEPTLFNDTIFANIAMGKPGNNCFQTIRNEITNYFHNSDSVKRFPRIYNGRRHCCFYRRQRSFLYFSLAGRVRIMKQLRMDMNL